MQIYGLKNCDTCRKALKALPEATFFDVRSDGVAENVLDAALKRFGTALVNTRSTTWRGLDDATRAEEPFALIKAQPAVMKRPLIVVGDQMYLGWTRDVQSALDVT